MAGTISQSEGSFWATLSETTKAGGATWLVAFPLKSFKWPLLKKKPLCSKFCNVKMKMPLKGTFPSTYRPNDPVLTSQLPFKGIESFFVDTVAMTVTWPARVSHKACQAPPPCHRRPRRQIWLCAKRSVSAHPAHRQAMASLATGWVRQQRPLFWLVCTQKVPLFDAFKWQLRCQYWIKWSVSWWEGAFKWQDHFSCVRIGIIKPCISVLFGSDLGQGGCHRKTSGKPSVFVALPPDLGLSQQNTETRWLFLNPSPSLFNPTVELCPC